MTHWRVVDIRRPFAWVSDWSSPRWMARRSCFTEKAPSASGVNVASSSGMSSSTRARAATSYGQSSLVTVAKKMISSRASVSIEAVRQLTRIRSTAFAA